MTELGALARGQVWLTLLTGAIGFGGLFAVYTYLGSTLIDVTGVAASRIPFAFAAFGAGMTIGNLVVPKFADRALMPTAGVLLIGSAVVLALYTFAAKNLALILVDVFAVGVGGALATVLQTRLMDVAGDAQSLAASLNHSAFNIANALGPWLGGIAIAAGFGLTSTGWVGSALAVGGLVVWSISLAVDRRSRT
jgi:DHA1 family inner membrane transport protein